MNGNLALVALLGACVACTTAPPEEEVFDDTDSLEARTDRAPLQMPEYPEARPGQLAIATSHRQEHYLVRNAWDAWVGKCTESGMVQVIARTTTHGVAVLIAPASEASDTLALPVLVSNDSIPPDSSARVAMQIYPDDRAYVLKGVDGTVEMSSVQGVVSGRFAVRLVEDTYRDTVLAAASFASIRLQTVSEEHCRPINAPVRSVPGEGFEPKPIPVGQVEDDD